MEKDIGHVIIIRVFCRFCRQIHKFVSMCHFKFVDKSSTIVVDNPNTISLLSIIMHVKTTLTDYYTITGSHYNPWFKIE